MPEEPFGVRLRRERERRHILLSSISANTKISVALFEGLERDDVSRWPSGIFRRAFIRSYASAIGLDAEAITREFLERYPDPEALPPPPEPSEPPAATARAVIGDAKRPLVVVTVRVPRWLTAARPWSRAWRASR